ncbi:hypothetical protein [Candidatus Lokiarchaeum ossiferum]|uniref:hypothetical protein n=1 Tax=Candidatus Lokiarchaeum ossiferum TaxID=2951803 RepID=UPI00352E5BE2
MIDKRVWKFRIKDFEVFTFFILLIIYGLVIIIKPNTPIYNWVSKISETIRNLAKNNSDSIWASFLISLGGNSSVLIVIPYALVIYLLSIQNPSVWMWIALAGGVGAAVDEIISYYIGRLISKSKKIQTSEFGEKFQRMKLQFEKNPLMVPWMVFFCAYTIA